MTAKNKLPPEPFSSATVEVTPEIGAFASITFQLKEPFRQDNKAKRGSYVLTHVIQFGGVVVSSSGKYMEVLQSS